MTGWMFLFMGIYDKNTSVFLFGLLLVIINFTFIRTQFMISQSQYILGMVPHHSMAVHMSKKLLQKNNNIKLFLQKIITTQENEINYMNYTNTLK
jgi:TctA family transporter